MITITRLAPGLLEIGIIGAPTDAEVRDIFEALRRETEEEKVSLLANVSDRTGRAPTIELFYRHIAGELADKIDRVGIVGEADESETRAMAEALNADVKAFSDKPAAIVWLKEHRR